MGILSDYYKMLETTIFDNAEDFFRKTKNQYNVRLVVMEKLAKGLTKQTGVTTTIDDITSYLEGCNIKKANAKKAFKAIKKLIGKNTDKLITAIRFQHDGGGNALEKCLLYKLGL